MSNNSKLAAAVVGGYVLGRTKKGKAAIRFAMWLSNNKNGPLGQTIGNVAQSPEISGLVTQLQGPLMEAIQKAAMSTVTHRVSALSNTLSERTKVLDSAEDITEGVGTKVKGTAGKATKSVGKTAGTVTGRLRKPKANDDPPTDEEQQGTEEPEDETPQETDDVTPEPEQEDTESDESDEPEQDEPEESKDEKLSTARAELQKLLADNPELAQHLNDGEGDQPKRKPAAKKAVAKKASSA